MSALRDVDVEELLGREPIKVNMEEIHAFIHGKKVMVTGGGGSIGSGLCRQIASYQPKQLIVFDIYENNAYDIQQELKKKYPDLDLVVLVGSIRDSRRINAVFETYRPEVVYHAAAHKHVPLMEDSPCESIKNNAIGTYKTAYAAMMNGCQRFVLISTDKAVNPTNIMGASKRLCEMIIQSFDRMIKEGTPEKLPILYAHADDEDGAMVQQEFPKDIKTEFVAVRFGNVLGSNGSVIPLFKKTDRRRRTGHGDSSGYYPLFHDDSGSGQSCPAGRDICAWRRNLCVGYGKSGEDRYFSKKPDQAVRIETGY